MKVAVKDSDFVLLDRVHDMEVATRIREWGKWSLLGNYPGTEIKPQIKIAKGKDATEWDAIPLISDDEGMRMNEAMRPLDSVTKEILRRLYMECMSTHDAGKTMRPVVIRNEIIKRRDRALSYLMGRLRYIE